MIKTSLQISSCLNIEMIKEVTFLSFPLIRNVVIYLVTSCMKASDNIKNEFEKLIN